MMGPIWDGATYCWHGKHRGVELRVKCKELGLMYDQWTEAISRPLAERWWVLGKEAIDHNIEQAPCMEAPTTTGLPVDNMISVKDYMLRHGLDYHPRQSGNHGRKLTALCRERGLFIGRQATHPGQERPGGFPCMVNAYPEHILDSYFLSDPHST
jgi:hypothetical protein